MPQPCLHLPDPGSPLAFARVRNLSLVIGLAVLLCLVLYQFLFSPSPTTHPFIMKSLEETEVLRTLNWYGENSVGSLQLPGSDLCSFNLEPLGKEELNHEAIPHLLPTSNPACSGLLKRSKSTRDLIQIAKEDPSLKPFIWRDSYNTVHLAIFMVRAENLISFKTENSILGAELDINASFKRLGLSPIIEKLKESESDSSVTAITSLRQQIGLEFSHHTRMKKYQSGYHLPVPPLP